METQNIRNITTANNSYTEEYVEDVKYTQIPARLLRRPSAEELASLQLEKDVREQKRQADYLDLAKVYTHKLAGILGRQPSYYVVNFGCQMNARDAEKLAGVLETAGFAESSEDTADFLIFNTCTVRDNADQHFFGRLGHASHLKKTNPYMKIAVCGCMMQEKANIDKVRRSYPYVDLIFGTHNLFRFPEYLCRIYEADPKEAAGRRRRLHVLSNDSYQGDGRRILTAEQGHGGHYNDHHDGQTDHSRNKQASAFDPRGQRILDVWSSTDEIVETLPVDRKYSFKSGININFGCNNFCTYCIVPYVRGPERSRRPEDIIHEIKQLVDDGVVEIMLLGQNVNSYGKDLPQPVAFARLLDDVASIPGLKRVRFMTPHPKDFSEDVVEVMKSHPNIARHVHLPLQSGSSRILRLMNRNYTKEQYLDLALYIRKELPDAAITTDIIAGFPGETSKDADDTIDVVRQVQYDNAYTFIYSPRQGTPAAKMTPSPEPLVKENFDRILTTVQECAHERTAMLKGSTQTILIEENNPQDKTLVTGRLSNNSVVHVKGDSSMIGRFYDVRLDECAGFYYFGSVVGENSRGW